MVTKSRAHTAQQRTVLASEGYVFVHAEFYNTRWGHRAHASTVATAQIHIYIVKYTCATVELRITSNKGAEHYSVRTPSN